MKNPVVEYYDNGQIKSEFYHINNGKLHCDDGPAIIYWYKNGQIKSEEYWINGYLYRKYGPAKIDLENGQIKVEHYFINGKRHREDGPAYIYYNNGQKLIEEYWINGKILDKFDIRKLKLEKLNLL